MMKAWRDQDTKGRGRLGEIALRVAVVTASANHDSEVTAECVQRALEFMEWQEQIRGRYTAGVGVHMDAICTETILQAMAEAHAAGLEWVRFTRLCQNRNWYKKFSSTRVSRVRQSLATEGMLIEEQEEVEGQTRNDGTGRPVLRKTGRVQLLKEPSL